MGLRGAAFFRGRSGGGEDSSAEAVRHASHSTDVFDELVGGLVEGLEPLTEAEDALDLIAGADGDIEQRGGLAGGMVPTGLREVEADRRRRAQQLVAQARRERTQLPAVPLRELVHAHHRRIRAGNDFEFGGIVRHAAP
jgi:hypothetical protein